VVGTNRQIRQAGITAAPDTSPLDELDRKIVRLLNRNGRASNTEIARDLDVSEATVRKRMARLIDEELIMVTAVPTPAGIGSTTAVLIGVSVRLDRLEAISERLVKHPAVRYVAHSTGRYDLMLEAFFPDVERLASFISNDLGSDPGVTQVETSLILKVAKFVYEWELP
jgi:Lrp/AsnC family transcriptional regulator, regulator for asnA, asnC and gidA